MIGLSLLTPPASEALTLAEVKTHLRVETSNDDTLIGTLIVAARLLCEAWTGRALMTQTWQIKFDDALCGNFIRLPKTPVQSVVHIKTYDDADAATVFSSANYFVDPVGGRVILRVGASWPVASRAASGYEVQFVSGYGSAGSDVPAPLRQGMLMHIARLYAVRGDLVGPDGQARGELPESVPPECMALYQPYRLLRGVA